MNYRIGYLTAVLLICASSVAAPRRGAARGQDSQEQSVEALARSNNLTQLRALLQGGGLEAYLDDPQGLEALRTLLREPLADRIVHELLTRGAPADVRNETGETLLHRAESAATAHLLLTLGVNPNAPDAMDRTPVFYAHTAEVAQELVDGGADLTCVDVDGYTVFETIAEREQTAERQKILAVLLVNHAPIAPMPHALNYYGIVRRVLEEQNYYQYDICSPEAIDLITCCFTGDLKGVFEILQLDDLLLESVNGITALNAAIGQGHVWIVRELLRHNAPVDPLAIELARTLGFTQIEHLLINVREQQEVAQILIQEIPQALQAKQNAPRDHQNQPKKRPRLVQPIAELLNPGQTPLHQAVAQQNDALRNVVTPGSPATPLHLTSEEERMVIGSLFDDVIPTVQATPLHQAVAKEDTLFGGLFDSQMY